MPVRLLLVDDRPEPCAAHRRILVDAGHTVTVVHDRSEALAALERGGAQDICLCHADLERPGGGVELLGTLRAALPDVVRVLSSARMDAELFARALNEAGVRRLVLEPAGEAELLEMVARCTRRREEESSALELVAAQARLARCSTFDELARAALDALCAAAPERGVHVQLWDDASPGGAIEASFGPEMSASMHREPLPGMAGPVGELVIDGQDAQGRPLSTRERREITWVAAAAGAATEQHLARRADASALDEAVLALGRLAELREEAGAHVERVARYALIVARGLRSSGAHLARLDDAFLGDLFRAAPLHDLGKVVVPAAVLLKRGTLGPSEWELVRSHTDVGARLIEELFPSGARHAPYLRMARDIALAHHEHWDGSGYPRGLVGDEIPLSARITAAADAYDALTRPRPYHAAQTHREALATLRKCAGQQLDPAVVDALVTRGLELDRVRARLADEPPGDARAA